MSDTFIPYRERPALDKGPKISWTDLESGMLFQPGAGAPTLRRVRGIPQFIWWENRSPSYMIGSEDEVDGRPCGGVVGCGDDTYIRSYLPDGRPVYSCTSDFPYLDDDAIAERLRSEFAAKIDETTAALAESPDDQTLIHRARIAKDNLTKLTEGPRTDA
jgi:hypothetical protein